MIITMDGGYWTDHRLDISVVTVTRLQPGYLSIIVTRLQAGYLSHYSD